MWVLLGLMLSSGYLGFKASQIRKVSPEERKAMVPLHIAIVQKLLDSVAAPA